MKFFVILGAVILLLVTFVINQKEPQKKETSTPMMISFSELKWTSLPERPGMQFAILSGDPKTGPYTQMRKVPEIGRAHV